MTKRNGCTGAAPTATGAIDACSQTQALRPYRKSRAFDTALTEDGHAEPTGLVLFEWPHKNGLGRIVLDELNGHSFLNIRSWYWKDDRLFPSKSGVTMPLARLPGLVAALSGCLGGGGEPGMASRN